MSQPLWRIMLAIMVLALVAQRAAMGVMLALDGENIPLAAAFGVQCLAGLLLWVGMQFVTKLIVPGLIALGGTFALGAVVGAATQAIPPSAATAQVMAALVGTTLFAYLARKAIEDDS